MIWTSCTLYFLNLNHKAGHQLDKFEHLDVWILSCAQFQRPCILILLVGRLKDNDLCGWCNCIFLEKEVIPTSKRIMCWLLEHYNLVIAPWRMVSRCMGFDLIIWAEKLEVILFRESQNLGWSSAEQLLCFKTTRFFSRSSFRSPPAKRSTTLG